MTPVNGLLLHTSERGLFLTYRDGTRVPGVLSISIDYQAEKILPEVTIRMVPHVKGGVLLRKPQCSAPLGLGYLLENPNGDIASNRKEPGADPLPEPIRTNGVEEVVSVISDEGRVEENRTSIGSGDYLTTEQSALDHQAEVVLNRLLGCQFVDLPIVLQSDENIPDKFDVSFHGSASGLSGVDQVPVDGDTSAGASFSINSETEVQS